VLFDDAATHDALLARIEVGDKIAVAQAAAGANRETDIRARLGATGLPMFLLTPGKDLRVLAVGDRPTLKPGQELIGLMKPQLTRSPARPAQLPSTSQDASEGTGWERRRYREPGTVTRHAGAASGRQCADDLARFALAAAGLRARFARAMSVPVPEMAR
jgi:hypothetical protein